MFAGGPGPGHKEAPTTQVHLGMFGDVFGCECLRLKATAMTAMALEVKCSFPRVGSRQRSTGHPWCLECLLLCYVLHDVVQCFPGCFLFSCSLPKPIQIQPVLERNGRFSASKDRMPLHTLLERGRKLRTVIGGRLFIYQDRNQVQWFLVHPESALRGYL